MTGAADFVRDFLRADPDLTGFILSAVSTVDPLRNSQEKMTSAEARYFRGMTQDEVDTCYRQLIATTKDNLLTLCSALEDVTNDGAICVIASDDQLDACGGQLEQKIEL